MKNLKQIIPYLTAVAFAILFLNQCNRTIDAKKQASSVNNFLRDSVTYYKNELGQEIAVKTALQGDKEALNVLLSKQIDSTGQLKRLVSKFRNVDAAGNITTITKFDTIKIGYEVPVPFEFSREWQKDTQWYSISGTSNQFGNTINTLEIPTTISFGIGSKKKDWFKTEYVFEAVADNPNVKITGLDGYSVKVPQKRLGVSIFAGYGMSKDGLSPILGAGLSYTLVRF